MAIAARGDSKLSSTNLILVDVKCWRRQGGARLSARWKALRPSYRLKDLDAKMGGLQPSDLIVIAGRPGMGKTSLATNIAFNVARAYQAPQEGSSSTPEMSGGIVAFFSLEMSSEQLATRVIAEQSEISSSNIRRGISSRIISTRSSCNAGKRFALFRCT
ncbi:RecA/RadA recombinase [Bradyrhizobium sp. USDA 10063]